MKIYQKTFESGLRLVFQRLDKDRPASFMIAVNVGSKDENEIQNGISHFIEHMNFKGTDEFSSKELTTILEKNGINFNASTSQLSTSFYGSTLPEKIEMAFDIFSKMIFESNYKQNEISKERKVIYKEIDMSQDSPEYVAYEKMYSDFYAGTPYEKLVSGTKKSLTKINRDEIVDFVKTHYVPNKIIVSVSGPFSKNYVKKLTQKYINFRFKENNIVSEFPKDNVIVPKRKFSFIKKDVKQSQIMIGFPTSNIYSEDEKANFIASFIFGGTMSSRLFQKVREQNALVYSIHCYNEKSIFGGANVISFGTEETKAKFALMLIKKEIEKFVKDGVTDEELDLAKTLCKSIILSSNEKGSNLTATNAKNMLIFNKPIRTEELMKSIEILTKEKVNEVIKTGFDFEHMVGAVVTKNIDKTLFDVFR